MKKKNTKSAVISGGVILLMVVVMAGYYYYLSNKEKTKEETNPKYTAVQEVLNRDLENNYPPTPKEVVKYYSEITKCFYNEEYSDGELELLADKANQLYDPDLLQWNDWGQYIISLRSQIKDFKDQKITISTYIVSSSTEVDFFEEDGFEFARLSVVYTLKQESAKQDVAEVFLLRKDEDGRWKIYGWDNAKNVEVPENED
ncbi:MAG: DUF4440 domain-containing protein [Lachnospiraceae bacterium]|nr:DUF4440 domain-containing protein [Lachnospiraceae bacterium]